MKSLKSCPVKVFATGFMVLVLLCLPLLWLRSLCEITLRETIPRYNREASIEPSGLVSFEIERDPNTKILSKVSALIMPVMPSAGIWDYVKNRLPEGKYSNIYFIDNKHEYNKSWSYFDEETGLLVSYSRYRKQIAEKKWATKTDRFYTGPEGISETPDKSLGRFVNPIVCRRSGIVYDKSLRRFFKINREQKTVTKGAKLASNDPRRPIQIGKLGENAHFINVDFSPPMRETTEEEKEALGMTGMPSGMIGMPPMMGEPFGEPGMPKGAKFQMKQTGSVPIGRHHFDAGEDILVLDESGRIDLLDKETLEFAGTAGYLPKPQLPFSLNKSSRPKELLAYDVLPVSSYPDRNYKGLCAATVSREGTFMMVAVFNEKGEFIERSYSGSREQKISRGEPLSASGAVLWNVPWGPFSMTSKYLLENLHPPLLSIVSYFTADSFEARAGHRALFVLPNSFIAMRARHTDENSMTEPFYVLLLILPSIILSILLAWHVSRDAAVVGLSENARLYWLVGTIAFGLIAYITYRLTRPKITLVTCQNCGKLRRPDIDSCHRCTSKWLVPELVPPTWRVTD
jgi:hypothetical protein